MIILGLGSNIGDRKKFLEKAVALIEERILTNINASQMYETEPMLPEEAQADWNKRFSNMAISGELKKDLWPDEVLKEVKKIEKELGRKDAPRWAPREIDIDILAWENFVFENDFLRIPHPSLTERSFAIVPLAEVAPEWIHPRTGVSGRLCKAVLY